METKTKDMKLFHKLVRNIRKKGTESLVEIEVNDQTYTGENEVLEGFYSHFEALATFNRQDNIDTPYHNMVDDNLIIESLVQNQDYAPVTQEEVSQAIKHINKGKSADYHGLTIEHILFSGNNMITLLTSSKIERYQTV